MGSEGRNPNGDSRGSGFEFSVVEVAGRRLVELEVGRGLGIGGVEAGRLVEQEVPLGRAAGEAGPVGEALTRRNMRCAGAPIRGGGGWRRRRVGR
jgi:hypothetical protein